MDFPRRRGHQSPFTAWLAGPAESGSQGEEAGPRQGRRGPREGRRQDSGRGGCRTQRGEEGTQAREDEESREGRMCVCVCVYNIFFIHSSDDVHLGCFHVLAILSSAAVNTGVHVSFQIMVFSSYMPRSRIAGSFGSSILVFKVGNHPHTNMRRCCCCCC